MLNGVPIEAGYATNLKQRKTYFNTYINHVESGNACDKKVEDRLVRRQWSEYSLIALEVANSIPAQNKYFFFLFLTLIPLSGVGTTCFHHVVIKIRHLFFTIGRLPDVNPSLKLKWVLMTANATGTNGLTCLPNHGGARDNKFWSRIL
jgi:hypothetical protein